MSKGSGGTRPVSPHSKAYDNRKSEAESLSLSGSYSSVEFRPKGGGYVAIEKGGKPHSQSEIEVAQYLSDSGYKVTLLAEGGQGFKVKTPDGKVFKASYEQRTPESSSVKNCLDHAKEKRADIALIYDKNKIYHRQDIEKGINEFESVNSKKRFQDIIVVESNGKVHHHKHNK